MVMMIKVTMTMMILMISCILSPHKITYGRVRAAQDVPSEDDDYDNDDDDDNDDNDDLTKYDDVLHFESGTR